MSQKLAAVVGLLLVGLALCGFSGPMQGTEESAGTPWWVWLLIIVVLLFAALLWWLWWSRRGEEKGLPAIESKRVDPVHVPEVKAPEVKLPEVELHEVEVPEVKVPEVELPEVELPDVQVPEVVARAAEVVLPKPDDLEIIEGIGPKIAGLLKAAGITTFAQLAEADLGRVQEILRAANLRLADPTTWAEQARLAAEGDWSALETLQNQLKGGRHA